MKIMIINPDYGMTDAEMDERIRILQPRVGPDVALFMQCLTLTPVTIDSALDIALASGEIIRMAIDAEREGFDAVVLYCFSDPAIDACREAVSIPVVGGGQASYLLALPIARQFGVLVSDKARIPEKRLFAHQAGVDAGRVIAYAAVDLNGRPAREDIAYTISRLVDAGRALIDHGAQAIVLGCLSFLGMAGDVSRAMGVPVVDSAVAPLVLAEALVRAGLSTSKASYPTPPSMMGGTCPLV